MSDDVRHVRTAFAAIDDRQLDQRGPRAAVGSAACPGRAQPRLERLERCAAGRAKLSMRLFMPGTASRTSGQLCRLARQRPDALLRRELGLAGRFEQQRAWCRAG